jgi:excisionase family DNA binding protein
VAGVVLLAVSPEYGGENARRNRVTRRSPMSAIDAGSVPRQRDELTVSQAAAESGFSKVTIRRHIEKGALPIVRRGPFRRIRIRRADFDRYMGSGH